MYFQGVFISQKKQRVRLEIFSMGILKVTVLQL
jgi:hypothetical protein